MKRTLIFALIISTVLSCAKTATPPTSDETSGDPIAFHAGQEVTLSVGAEVCLLTDNETKTENGNSKGTRISGTVPSSGSGIELNWQTGDKIRVTVGGKSSDFTLATGEGTGTATFTGTMPQSGSEFSVQYPATDTPIDLTTQTYIANGISTDKLQLTASKCTLGSPVSLLPDKQSILRLNLYGTSKTVGQIVVTNTTSKVSYTLNCKTTAFPDGVKVGSTKQDSTSFRLLVPVGSYSLTAEIYDNAATPTYICSFKTSSTLTFSGSKVLSLVAKELKLGYPGTELEPVTIDGVTWAPVNCGYDDAHPYGLLYQWGRNNGQEYYDEKCSPGEKEPTISYAVWNEDNGKENNGTFYIGNDKATSYTEDWILVGSNEYWNKAKTPNDAEQTSNITPQKGDFDPCPNGWRVPTYYELITLASLSNTWETDKDLTGKSSGDYNGRLFGTSPNQLFLLAAGNRNYINGDKQDRSTGGFYWSSSVEKGTGCGQIMKFWEAYVPGVCGYARAYGASIRCVKDTSTSLDSGSLGSLTRYYQ